MFSWVIKGTIKGWRSNHVIGELGLNGFLVTRFGFCCFQCYVIVNKPLLSVNYWKLFYTLCFTRVSLAHNMSCTLNHVVIGVFISDAYCSYIILCNYVKTALFMPGWTLSEVLK